MGKTTRLFVVTSSLILGVGAVAGCNNSSGSSVPKEEEAKFRAPLGQPMPPEARAAMEKARQQAPAPNTPAK